MPETTRIEMLVLDVNLYFHFGKEDAEGNADFTVYSPCSTVLATGRLERRRGLFWIDGCNDLVFQNLQAAGEDIAKRWSDRTRKLLESILNEP